MGRIYYLMGKSACGKDTLYRKLCQIKPELNTYIMYTTRPIREGEADGVSYVFTDEKTITSLRDSGRLIESRSYNTVQGRWIYATADDGQINLEKGDYIALGTLESYMSLRNYFGDDAVFPLYIEVEDSERLMRAIRREQCQKRPDYREVCRRFLADDEDFSEERLKRAGIGRRFSNMSFEKCLDDIIGVIG